MPISDNERKKARIRTLLAPVYRTPEFAAVEEFLLEDPDIGDVPSPFDTLFFSAYDHQVRSVRKKRMAQERLERAFKKAEREPAPQPEPAATTEPLPSHYRLAQIAEFEALRARANEDEPVHPEVAKFMLEAGWDYKTLRSTNRFTPEEDEKFLTDVRDSTLPDSKTEVNENHKQRLFYMGRDFLKWLAKQRQTEDRERARKPNGS